MSDAQMASKSGLSRTLWMICVVMMLSSLGLVTGCASTKTTQRVLLATGAVKADQSRVYVYCIKGLQVVPANISDGDSPIGDVMEKGYICWDRVPGKTVIRARMAHGKGVFGDLQAELPLDLTGGQTYYVQVYQVNPAQAVAIISPLIAAPYDTLSLLSPPPQEAAADIARECKAPVVSASNGK
jgi:hypothetical protein